MRTQQDPVLREFALAKRQLMNLYRKYEEALFADDEEVRDEDITAMRRLLHKFASEACDCALVDMGFILRGVEEKYKED